jgi:lysophospholipase L1-like esterase
VAQPGTGRGAVAVAGAAAAVATIGSLTALRQLIQYQSATADRRMRPLATPAPPSRESYGEPGDPPFTLALLGDSSAQGIGVTSFDDALGGWVGTRLAADGWFVRVVTAAQDGSRAEHLADQVASVLPERPRLVLISTGVNDVRHRTPPKVAARLLAEAVGELRAAGADVVVGTAPNLGVVALGTPLRQVAGLSSVLMARAQAPAVRAAGGVPVALGRDVSPLFAADRTLFAPDGLHPSARGYAVIGAHLLAAVPARHRVPDSRRPDGRRSR